MILTDYVNSQVSFLNGTVRLFGFMYVDEKKADTYPFPLKSESFDHIYEPEWVTQGVFEYMGVKQTDPLIAAFKLLTGGYKIHVQVGCPSIRKTGIAQIKSLAFELEDDAATFKLKLTK